MRKNENDDQATKNFLSTMNTSLPLIMNIMNANYDRIVYGWDNQVFKELLNGIYEAYNAEKAKKRKSK